MMISSILVFSYIAVIRNGDNMQELIQILQAPWPWFVSGPLIGLMVPLFIVVGSRSFGISQNLEHLCAITQPRVVQVKFFKYDWRISTWSLVFTLGVGIGGFLAGALFANPEAIQLRCCDSNVWSVGAIYSEYVKST